MMVQVVTAVRLLRSHTEGHASSAGKADVVEDVVAEEMAAGPRTGTARRTALVELKETKHIPCIYYTSI